jgi:hypothetical protein
VNGSLPTGSDRVICALRLGWAVSELRGRFRPGETLIAVQPQTGHLRDAHALPLGGERTVTEQLIEAEAVVSSLAAELSLDVDDLTPGEPKPASERLVELAKDLSRAREHKGDVDGAWNALALFLYLWDARIQDELAGAAFSVASAYQLGRGLGDIAWLDPGQVEPDIATSWGFVLGPLRVGTLKRLAGRLADYFQPHTGRGLAASLDVWRRAAADAGLRDKSATRSTLVAQTKRWRDLLLTGLDPRELLPPNRFLARARQVKPLLHAYWPELLAGSIFAVLLAVGAAVLATSSDHGWATLVSVLGAIGATSSALLAKAKTEALGVATHLQAKLDADLVRDAVIVSPFPEEHTPWWHFW